MRARIASAENGDRVVAWACVAEAVDDSALFQVQVLPTVLYTTAIALAVPSCTVLLVVLSYLSLLSGEQDSCQDGRDFVLGNVIGIEEESRPRVARRTRPMHGRESAVDSYEVLCWRVG